MKYIESAIQRFLKSKTAEVICITGKWGVGKTFEWDRMFKQSAKDNTVALERYSYVTLFGLNSLDDVRRSIFENTVTGDSLVTPPDAQSYLARLQELPKLGMSHGFIELISNRLFGEGASKTILSAAFLSVRNQLVCFDDIERAGSDLNPKDILGLASFLKEQRGCKVVLLLNQDELGTDQVEFKENLEKVVDVALEFKPTAQETAKIALDESSKAAALMAPYVIRLQITNIRVIKKVLRIAEQVVSLLDDYDDAVLEHAIASLVLGGWSIYQPSISVPLEFIRHYNSVAYTLSNEGAEVEDNGEEYHRILRDYSFGQMDELDSVVFDAVLAGYVNETQLIECANAAQLRLRQLGGGGEFSKVWRDLYHGSLITEDQKFLSALFDAAMSEVEYISLSNINSAIRVIREFEGDTNADALASAFVNVCEGNGLSFLNLSHHSFANYETLDEHLVATMKDRYDSFIDERDPFSVLVKIGEERKWSEADARILARQSADEIENLLVD